MLIAALLALSGARHASFAQESRPLVFQGGLNGNNFEMLWKWLTTRLEKDPAWAGRIRLVPSDGIGGLDALAAGKADFTLVKAPATVAMAYRGIGRGLFDKRYENIRSFGLLPVPDWLTFAVRPGITARSVSELLRLDTPLRIATGRDAGRDVVTFILQEILGVHGSSFKAIEERNGAIVRLDPGASLQAGLDGRVDAVFQEASSIPQWDKLFAAGWTVVVIDAPALAHLERQFGFGRTTIPPAWHKGRDPIDTVNFSNVLLCVRAETPEQAVALVTRTVLDGRKEIEEMFRVTGGGRRAWLRPPIEDAFFATKTPVPHHPGALRAFK
jgi:TRAP-type uncharacterized transport system substrate-binding protein